MKNKPLKIRTTVAYFGVLDKQKHIFTKKCFKDLVRLYDTDVDRLFVRKEFKYDSIPIGYVTGLEIEENALVANIEVTDNKFIEELLENSVVRPGFFVPGEKLIAEDKPIVFDKIKLLDFGIVEKTNDVYDSEDL